ncbi:hypothetical protein [Streptomyces sp. A012304]|uniref:hypothetical protein n=1 Tax=Streptomyces sp. A012304 TaxID=375446 RepID=UPI0022315226|nr:hypothetical protein [Streptomyces sp. A012304]GKQ41003.1 hypothetical protein ALMP_75220 [Streptomyces sp. A012304]
MNRPAREAAARQIMESTAPRVPAELHADVVRAGNRILRLRTLARRLLWLLLCAAALAFTVWAIAVEPWAEPPSRTTPPLTGW